MESVQSVVWCLASSLTKRDPVCENGCSQLERPQINISFASLYDRFPENEVTALYNTIGTGVVRRYLDMWNSKGFHKERKCFFEF